MAIGHTLLYISFTHQSYGKLSAPVTIFFCKRKPMIERIERWIEKEKEDEENEEEKRKIERGGGDGMDIQQECYSAVSV